MKINSNERKHLENILFEEEKLNSLLQILNKYFLYERDYNDSIDTAYQLFNYICKKHNKLINKIDKHIIDYTELI